MVDIYGRLFTGKSKTKPTDIDLSKYATRDEVNDLLNLAGVDPEEVVIFQDKQGKLKTNNVKLDDIIRRVPGATSGNFVEFVDKGRIKDSNTSIKDINYKITKSVADRLKTNCFAMTGELSFGGNKITVLRDPTSAEDAVNKQYVDAGDATVDNKLSTLRTECDAHVVQFARLRRNFQRNDDIVEEFYGKPLTVDMKLSEIKTSLSDINTRLGVVSDPKSFSDLIAELQLRVTGIVTLLNDVASGVPQITARTSLIKISTGVAPKNIVNISYVVSAGSATWSQENNSIKHTGATIGIYRLSEFSAEKFKILTRYPWRHYLTDKFSGVASMVLNSGTEEEFILEAADKKLNATTYWWCLEVVAETPQLVTG